MRRITPGVGALLFGGLVTITQLAFAQLVSTQLEGGTLEGRWGGDRLQLTLDANGGRLELDCASGTIAGPVKSLANGKFSAVGTFDQHSPGPQRADEAAAVGKARYSGEIHDGAMTLSILAAGAGAPQVFHLRKGAAVKLVRCL